MVVSRTGILRRGFPFQTAGLVSRQSRMESLMTHFLFDVRL
jgi:hypothetical protein